MLNTFQNLEHLTNNFFSLHLPNEKKSIIENNFKDENNRPRR